MLPSEKRAALSEAEGPDDQSAKEAKLLASDLDQEEIANLAAANEHKRNEKFRDHFECIAVSALWVAAATILIVAAVWLWHMLMPSSWHWLSKDEIHTLQNLVTGGMIATLATGHFKRRLS